MSDRRPDPHCHAGGEQHGPACDRGVFGVLCEPCWQWCLRMRERLRRAAAKTQ
jgi:hypothetical protein